MLEGGWMEGRFPIKEFVDDDAEWPDVNFVIVSLIGQNLRRNIERGAFDGIHECGGCW